jgi:hypothetical protein
VIVNCRCNRPRTLNAGLVRRRYRRTGIDDDSLPIVGQSNGIPRF